MLSLGLGRFQVKINMFFNLFFMQKTPKNFIYFYTHLLTYSISTKNHLFKNSNVVYVCDLSF